MITGEHSYLLLDRCFLHKISSQDIGTIIRFILMEHDVQGRTSMCPRSHRKERDRMGTEPLCLGSRAPTFYSSNQPPRLVLPQ